MGSGRSVPALLAAAALLATCLGATAYAHPPDEAGDRFPTPTGVDPDRVLLRVEVAEDGSAAWAVTYRVRLDDPNATEGFERFRERLDANRSAVLGPFRRRMRGMAAEAEDATSREMVVENVSVEAEQRQLPQEYGVVTYRFRWYGFADRGERLVVGDALRGLFLDPETRLLVTWPARARPESIAPSPDERRDRTAVWSGPLDFGSGEPRIVLSTDGGFASEGGDGFPVEAVGTAALLALLVGATVGRFGGRRAGGVSDDADDGGTADEPPDPVTGSGGDSTTSTGTESPPTGDGATDDGDDGDDPAPEPPEELLSNEERVLAILRDSGGRVKQADVVEETGWSTTKTSDVVADLREADRIEVYRLGRENVLALPGQSGFEIGGDDE